jgi:hypothetical protein
MAATAFLEITDRLAPTANDETHCAVRYHNLRRLLAFTKRRLDGFGSRAATGSASSLTCGIPAVFFNDAIDLSLCSEAGALTARDTALSLRAAVWAVDELNSGRRFLLNATKTLTLAPNHETNQRRINQDNL